MPLPSGMDSTAPYNTTRARPCPSAVSLVVQLWQARQSLQLVRSAERRLRIRHGAILRIRPDIFFFRPVELPRPPPGLTSWYSMFEESCRVREGVSEAVYGKANLRFLQDFWLYGSRDVMEVALQEPLERLLGFGRDAAAFMACATCHDRPATITSRRHGGRAVLQAQAEVDAQVRGFTRCPRRSTTTTTSRGSASSTRRRTAFSA